MASSNEHFSVPQGVEKYYTGRANFLEDVKHSFTAPESPSQGQVQRRIVIYGVGGSGKTQFCCKYAQLYRQKSVDITQCLERLIAGADMIAKLLGYLLDQCKLRRIGRADVPIHRQGWWSRRDSAWSKALPFKSENPMATYYR